MSKLETADLSAKRGCAADLAAYWRGLRRFYDPRGRASRTEFFMLVILSALIAAIVQFVIGNMLSTRAEHTVAWSVSALVLIPVPAAAARRFHDMGKSGWFALPVLLLCLAYFWHIWGEIETGPVTPIAYSGSEPTLELLYGFIGVMFAIILMQPPQHLTNPYGSDPRPAPKVI
ncbi:DUF805 domain-containing protein [Erythrobacter alti]|uniref:DUF805 domain-containing protein n=1 Tax=Erythrobacter alti TaxID=1896145 RepID=UPI0030F3FA55